MQCREAFRAEQTITSPTELDVLTHRASVVSTITSATAALEAMINEAYCDAVETNSSCIAQVPAEKRAQLAERWEREDFPRTHYSKILVKFDIAHLLITGKELNKADPRWCDALLVTRLRNHFAHFKPSWRTHGTPSGLSDESTELEKELKDRFPESPLCGAMNPFYPDKLLGHGCAEWSIVSAIAFADMFWSCIGVVPVYEAYREMLHTKLARSCG